MAPARASASGRAAHCPSCFSHHRDRLILLLPPSLLASGSGGWMAWSLAFLTPFFTGDYPCLSLSLSLFVSLFPPRLLSGTGPRCSETLHNGVTWPLLSRAHTPRSYPIAYTSPLPESHPAEVNPLSPFSSVLVLHYAYSPPDKWRVRRTVRWTGLVYIYNTGWRKGWWYPEYSRSSESFSLRCAGDPL